jgi:hypothetical protein
MKKMVIGVITDHWMKVDYGKAKKSIKEINGVINVKRAFFLSMDDLKVEIKANNDTEIYVIVQKLYHIKEVALVHFEHLLSKQ